LSIQHIIESLKKLLEIHDDLLKISEQKTEIVKDGSTEKLQALLVKERKYVRLAEQAETKRMEEVTEWFTSQQLPLDDISITYILENIGDEKQKKLLEELTLDLTETILKLKQQEKLNQDLLHQSMEFVQLSLEMLSPSIQNMNYGKDSFASNKLSVFDSKA